MSSGEDGRSHRGTMWFWILISISACVEFGLVLDLFHEPYHLLHTVLATFGAVYAILAMLDAHRAFETAKEVEEAVGSFRMSFAEVMIELVAIVGTAQRSLLLVLPTPAYGHLFGEQVRAIQLVEKLEAFLRSGSGSLELCLMLGEKDRPRNLAQEYLRKEYAACQNAKLSLADSEYCQLVRRVFTVMQENSDRARLWVLRVDPNVRIAIADAEDPATRVSFLAFAQAHFSPGPFDAKGFRSTRPQMIRAIGDLVELYKQDLGESVEPHQVDFHFHTLLYN